jgi:hypothetical protein
MIKMIDRKIEFESCKRSLHDLSELLNNNRELEETGSKGLQEHFETHPDLLLLMGDCFLPSLSPAAYQREFSILGEFRADFAISNEDRSKFLFIEFENAKEDSVFVKKTDGKTVITYEWSPRFEHGFSQIVDWHYRMDDLRRSSKIQEHFGSNVLDYEGILIIGRDEFIRDAGGGSRLRWRKEKVLVDNHRVHCLTFDGLLTELAGRFEFIEAIRSDKF